jgi:hypothetical protein
MREIVQRLEGQRLPPGSSEAIIRPFGILIDQRRLPPQERLTIACIARDEMLDDLVNALLIEEMEDAERSFISLSHDDAGKVEACWANHRGFQLIRRLKGTVVPPEPPPSAQVNCTTDHTVPPEAFQGGALHPAI